jgi:putative endonuclease
MDGFTKRYHVCQLVYYEEYFDIRNAILREKEVKNLLRRKKEELIDGFNPQWNDLYDSL